MICSTAAKKEGGTLEITYVSMHAIQRRMQAEGLGQEADVSDLHLAVERNLRLDAMRAEWEPRIRAEMAAADRLNPKQQCLLSTKWRLRHGSLASMWLTGAGLCYVLSERGEVVTVHGLDNTLADALDRFRDRPTTKIAPNVERNICAYKKCHNATPGEARFCKEHEIIGPKKEIADHFKATGKRCEHKRCPNPQMPDGRFCELHVEIGPQYERAVAEKISRINERLRNMQDAIRHLQDHAAHDADRTDPVTHKPLCCYKRCRSSRGPESRYCPAHLKLGTLRDLNRADSLAKAQVSLRNIERELRDLKAKAPNQFENLAGDSIQSAPRIQTPA